MRSLALDYEDSTHTLYSVTVVGISLHIFVDISYQGSCISNSRLQLVAFDPLLQRKEASQRQYVFANKRDIGNGRGAQICGIDRKVILDVAAEQLMIAGFQHKERIVILGLRLRQRQTRRQQQVRYLCEDVVVENAEGENRQVYLVIIEINPCTCLPETRCQIGNIVSYLPAQQSSTMSVIFKTHSTVPVISINYSTMGVISRT